MKVKVIRENEDLGLNPLCAEHLKETSLLIETHNKLYFIKYSELDVLYRSGAQQYFFSIDTIIAFRK